MPFLVGLLASPDVEEKAELVQVLGALLGAARFQLGRRSRQRSSDLDSLLVPEKLWPSFVSDEIDEILWEEWSPSDADYQSWAELTECAIVAGRDVLRRLVEVAPGMAAAAALLARIERPLAEP